MARRAGARRAETHGRRGWRAPRTQRRPPGQGGIRAVMKTVMWACLGFTLGLGGTTAVLAVRGPDAGAEGDELAADSASVALADSAALAAADSAVAEDSVIVADSAAVADSVAAAAVAKDDVAESGAAGAPAGAGALQQDAASGAVRAAMAAPPAEETGKNARAAERVAKIFGAMDAQDAARVLELLQNNQVQTILAHMSERKVAAILVHLDPARAAELSRQAMRTPETH